MTKENKLRLSVVKYFASQLEQLAKKENVSPEIVDDFRKAVDTFGGSASESDIERFDKLIGDPIKKDDSYSTESKKQKLKVLSVPVYFDIDEYIEDKGNFSEEMVSIIHAIAKGHMDKRKVGLCDKGHLVRKDNSQIILPKEVLKLIAEDLSNSPQLFNQVNLQI